MSVWMYLYASLFLWNYTICFILRPSISNLTFPKSLFSLLFVLFNFTSHFSFSITFFFHNIILYLLLSTKKETFRFKRNKLKCIVEKSIYNVERAMCINSNRSWNISEKRKCILQCSIQSISFSNSLNVTYSRSETKCQKG